MSDRSLFDAIQFVDTELGKLRLNLKPGMRFDLMRRAFLTEDGTPRTVDPDDPQFAVAIEALRDVTLLEFILENRPAGVSEVELRTELNTMLKDHVDPVAAFASSAPSRGRAKQVELFVAAMCERAGLHPVELVEPPDVRCRFDGRFLGFAVKRPQSQDNIQKLLSDGAEQVQRAGIPGILFVDLSLALNQKNEWILRPMDDASFELAFRLALRTWWDREQARMVPHIRDRGVFALLLQVHVPRQILGVGWRLSSLQMLVQVPDGTHNAVQRARRFERAFAHALEWR